MSERDYSTTTQDKEYNAFYEKIRLLSSIQGSVAYILMSVLVVHRETIESSLGGYFFPFLYFNMVYGMATMMYMRPAMHRIHKTHRISFSLLGSLMFNNACMKFFRWTVVQLPEQPWTRTAISFVGGRLILFYFIAYLYHVDSTVGITLFQRIR